MLCWNRYELKATVDNAADAKDLTLYEACKALAAAAADGQVKDATHIRRDDRCVAFWCGWKKQVRSMFGADKHERHMVDTWAFKAPRRRTQ